MKIAIVENNLITGYGENTELFPNVSFSVLDVASGSGPSFTTQQSV